MKSIYHLPFFGLLICLLSANFAWGQTAVEEDSRDVLPVRNEKESLSLRSKAITDLKKAVENIEEAERLSNAGKTAEINYKKLGEAHVLLNHVADAGNQLDLRGEPAGQYLKQSSNSLIIKLSAIVKQYLESTPNRARFSDPRPLTIIAKKNQRQLLRVATLANKAQWEEADRLMKIITDEIRSVDILSENSSLSAIFQPYWELNGKLGAKLNLFRLAQHRESNLKRRKNLTPNFQKLLSQLAAAQISISESGQAPFGLKQVSGPEWVSLFYASWRKTYVDSMQCFGLDISRFNVDANNAAPAARDLLAGLDNFAQRIPEELAKIVQADTARISAESAKQLHASYLQAFAPYVIGANDENYIQVLQPALNDLAAKLPEFADDVRVYHIVTEDVLRWRQRVADGYHSAKTEQFPQLSTRLNLTNGTNGSNTRVMVASAGNEFLEAIRPVPELRSVIELGLKNSLVSVHNVSPPPNTDRPAVSQFDKSLFARVLRDYDITSVIAELKSALLITDDTPGLTLRTAAAIYSAENEAFEIVGGEVEDFSLVGRITYFCNTTEDDVGLFGLGSSPGASTGGNYYRQVLIECLLKPKWMKHRYFFVELN